MYDNIKNEIIRIHDVFYLNVFNYITQLKQIMQNLVILTDEQKVYNSRDMYLIESWRNELQSYYINIIHAFVDLLDEIVFQKNVLIKYRINTVIQKQNFLNLVRQYFQNLQLWSNKLQEGIIFTYDFKAYIDMFIFKIQTIYNFVERPFNIKSIVPIEYEGTYYGVTELRNLIMQLKETSKNFDTEKLAQQILPIVLSKSPQNINIQHLELLIKNSNNQMKQELLTFLQTSINSLHSNFNTLRDEIKANSQNLQVLKLQQEQGQSQQLQQGQDQKLQQIQQEQNQKLQQIQQEQNQKLQQIQQEQSQKLHVIIDSKLQEVFQQRQQFDIQTIKEEIKARLAELAPPLQQSAPQQPAPKLITSLVDDRINDYLDTIIELKLKTHLTKASEKLKDEIQSLQNALQTNINEFIHDLNESFKIQVTQPYEALNDKVDTLAENFDKYIQEIHITNEEIKKTQEAFALKSDFTLQQQNINDIIKRIETLTSKYEALTRKFNLRSNFEEIQNMKDNIEDIKNRLMEVQNKQIEMDKTKGQIQNLIKLENSLKEKLQTIDSQLEDAETLININTNLETKVKHLDEWRQAIESKLNDDAINKLEKTYISKLQLLNEINDTQENLQNSIFHATFDLYLIILRTLLQKQEENIDYYDELLEFNKLFLSIRDFDNFFNKFFPFLMKYKNYLPRNSIVAFQTILHANNITHFDNEIRLLLSRNENKDYYYYGDDVGDSEYYEETAFASDILATSLDTLANPTIYASNFNISDTHTTIRNTPTTYTSTRDTSTADIPTSVLNEKNIITTPGKRKRHTISLNQFEDERKKLLALEQFDNKQKPPVGTTNAPTVQSDDLDELGVTNENLPPPAQSDELGIKNENLSPSVQSDDISDNSQLVGLGAKRKVKRL